MLAIVFATEPKPFRPSVWRITFIFTLLVSIIMGVLLLVMYQEFTESQEQQIVNQLAIHKQRFEQLAQTANQQTFITQIELIDPTRSLVVWQPKSSESTVIGALSFMPQDLPYLPQNKIFPVFIGGEEKLFRYTGGLVRTPYGLILIATRSDQIEQLQQAFLHNAITTMLVTIGLTFILGFLFSKALLARLNAHNRLSLKIEQGDYDTRFPVSKAHDEVDYLICQFNRVLDTLQQNLAAVRGITDNIAHDLRTPLSHLRLGLEQLCQHPDPQVNQQSSILIEELDHCLATFDAMLSLTRIEEGQQQLNYQAFSLTSLCLDLGEMAQPVAQAHEQDLQVITGIDPKLMGDKQLLFGALYNLVDNAIKYAGEGASIEIVQQDNQVEIKDTGVGIADCDKNKVFDRLVRLDPSRHDKGTGLGLSMVRAILERHNAKIELLDNIPQGLIAKITFHKYQQLKQD